MAMQRVTTTGGRVRGYPGRNQKVSVFKGVPFARAERWGRPRPVSWEDELDASHFTTICPQRVFRPEGGTELAASEFYAVDYPMGEDCLVANVWTPAVTPDEGLPVAVYIHGGAFETGYGWLNAYDGEGFCRRGVILVTLNYRLNVFGFLALPELRDADGAVGTYGVLDQLAGLEWVRDNIAAFGGDPGRVTVFGQSAGGMSVANLLNSPLSDGLIHGAIMQSGGGLTHRTVGAPLDLDDALATGRDFLAASGCRTVAELRALPASDLLARYVSFAEGRPMPFQPVVDGVVIPERPVDFFGAGRHADIPTIVGATNDEMRDLTAGVPSPDAVRAFAARFGERASEFLAALDAQGGPRASDFSDPTGDQFLAGSLAWCDNQARLGRGSTWLYQFTYVPPTAGMAHHSAEHHYVFETLSGSARSYTADDYDLALDLAGYWTNFVKTGDPNGPKYPGGGEPLPVWTPWDPSDPQALIVEPEPRMGELVLSVPRTFLRESIGAAVSATAG